ncbi:hypothetical protein PBAL39_14239 [Pedobacter sp. BAL39]|uniref:iron chaperone n=1 Tax=Pedobacter sp. BAL39 TaxID=391596 RepID=UPI000155AD58|nr:DUF1801 domain-containing protein [Pedobacter sp. BAL39]EDM34723.1 hypothetical protein PBAL39_14239 [Pedobacter sp. BAL39]
MMQKSESGTATTIDGYIAMQPAAFRDTLSSLRELIISTVPEAEEKISYQVPVFKYHYSLVGMGVSKKYCSFYVMSPSIIKDLKEELKGIQVSGSTIHFRPQQALPEALIRKIVMLRKAENELRFHLKKS